MFGPRWNKIIRELWMNRGRSLLVILSIAIGVAAIGAVIGTQETLATSLPASFAKITPASATLITDPFDADLVETVLKVPGVTAAEGMYVMNVRLQRKDGSWQAMQLAVYPDFLNIAVNKLTPQSGNWPPPDREVAIERGSLALTGAQVGDVLSVQMPDGSMRSLPITGLVHDLNKPSGVFSNQVSGYITLNTLEWLGYAKSFNEIVISTTVPNTGNPETDLQAVRDIATQARLRIERSGITVYWTTVQDPRQHWFQPYLAPMSSVLGALGGLALLLSGFLVINTISALLAQQIRQIGVMKAIGGRVSQIGGIFTSMVLIFGLLALAVAIPLGYLGTLAALNIVAGFINFDIPPYQIPMHVILIQAALSLIIPSLTALFPIRLGTRIPVREAIGYSGIRAGASFGSSAIDRLFTVLQGLPHPLLLSLRNTFRRKSRLILTLITLTLGSAIFIAVQNVQASLLQTLDETLQYYNFDVAVNFDRPYRVEQIQQVMGEIPAVKTVEAWGVAEAHRLRPNNSESDGIMFVAPPVGTQMIKPILASGRWLVPQDQNAVVINTDLARQEPDLKVGSELVFKVNGRESTWKVVGIVRSVLMGPWVYANLPYFAETLNVMGVSSAVYITTQQHDETALRSAVQQIETHLQQQKVHFSSVATVSDLRNATILQFQVITGFLMVMALLIALVGGLGLMGTMSMNVLERSREIGIMRAVGARNGMIQAIVITEGMFIGFLSWLAGVLLSLPFSSLLDNLVGMGFLQSTLSDKFSTSGALLWLGIILVISIFASMAPAARATRYAIREVLAYE